MDLIGKNGQFIAKNNSQFADINISLEELVIIKKFEKVFQERYVSDPNSLESKQKLWKPCENIVLGRYFDLYTYYQLGL